MYKVMKKQGKIVEAYRLGDNSKVLDDLEKNNKLLNLNDGRYEVFSQEAVNSESGHGQIAKKGGLDTAG